MLSSKMLRCKLVFSWAIVLLCARPVTLRQPIATTEDLTVTTIAGSGSNAFQDGSGNQALFSSPSGSVVIQGHVYVADSGNK
jgi:hypothetical protein